MHTKSVIFLKKYVRSIFFYCTFFNSLCSFLLFWFTSFSLRSRILDWLGSHLSNDPKEKVQSANYNGKLCWNGQNRKLCHIQTNGKCKYFTETLFLITN